MSSTASLAKGDASHSDGFEKRKIPSYPLGHRIQRAIWGLTWLFLASWTPPFFRRWRIFLLNLFGANVHSRADVRGSARVWLPKNLTMGPKTTLGEGVICYNMAPVTIHHDTVVSQRTHICAGTHDYRLASHPLVTKPIEIGPYAWVAAEVFLAPGTTVSEGCVVGARSVVHGKLKPWMVYSGHPATILKPRPLDMHN